MTITMNTASKQTKKKQPNTCNSGIIVDVVVVAVSVVVAATVAFAVVVVVVVIFTCGCCR